MEQVLLLVAIWMGLAIVSAVIASHLRISIALVEIVIGVIGAAVAFKFFGAESLGENSPWLKFIAAMGAILLTFLAGIELDAKTMRSKLKEVTFVGLMGFFAPFVGCALLAYYALGWDTKASLLAGIALSTTSMAVVYAVMLETGLNKTSFGKGILGSCFINDLGTVIALGLIFAPFTYKTIVFLVACAILFVLLPPLTNVLTDKYGNKTAAIRTKWVLLILSSLGALAVWAGSEAVLPAYIAGMVMSNSLSRDPAFLRRFRTLTVGFLTPFYFIRAGSLVSPAALIGAPVAFLVLLGGKVISKIFGLYPIIKVFRKDKSEGWYYTLLMSTGLTFGTISALYGLSHNIVTQSQYSLLVAAVIASAVIPTMIAGFFFLPKHLMNNNGNGNGDSQPQQIAESGQNG